MKKRKMAKFLLTMGIVVILSLLALTSCIIGMVAGGSKGRTPASSSSQQLTSTSTSSQVETTITQVPEAATTTSPPAKAEATPVETVPETSGMQLDQLIAGDFSSIEGVWVNGYGTTLTFGPSGLIDGNERIQGLKYTEHGTLNGSIVSDSGQGGVVEFLPAGTAFADLSNYTDEEEVIISDASDKQQDRIWAGQDYYNMRDEAAFFYRR